MDELRKDIRAAFGRQQMGLGDLAGVQPRLLQAALAGRRRSNVILSLAGAAATLIVATLVAVVVLLTHGRAHQDKSPLTIEQALTSGPAAAPVPAADKAFVWLTGPIISPQSPGSQSGRIIGVKVDVIDWNGKVRDRFEIRPSPGANPNVPNEIQSISPDGTRALLQDGTVIDQKGAVLGKLPGLGKTENPGNATRWLSDDQHICASFSNQPVEAQVAPQPKGLATPKPTPPPAYSRADADHSVTLKVFALDGTIRTVATVARGPQGVQSGGFPDTTSVVACSQSTDLAVIARYHDADTSGGQSSTNLTVSLWAIKLSSGELVYHTPETRMALGRAFFFGSQNARLAVEFLWNSRVAGSETDVVLRMPSGQEVPVLDSEPIPDTPGLSADGTRILRRLVDDKHSHTLLELIDAADGHVIRRVEIPALVGASAVAQPDGSSFIVQVESYLVLVDGQGGISLLRHDASLGQAPGSVGLSGPPLQG